MKKIVLLLLFVFAIVAHAQNRVDRANPTISKPIATLLKAVGWRVNTETGIWNKADNAIEGLDRLDQFNRFEFRIVTNADSSYLLLRKNYEIGHYTFPTTQKGWVGHKAYVDWVIPLQAYRQRIDSLSTTDNEMMFSVLTSNFDIETEGQTMPKINVKEKTEKQSLIIKFRLDDANKTARFFIYSREELGNGFFNIKYLSNNHIYNSYTPEGEIINSNKLYENFYYETSKDAFLNFIKAPTKP